MTLSPRAFGGGKVILLGEHSVVYGHPALAAGLEIGAYASATPSEHGTSRLQVSPWDVDLSAESDEPLGQALAAALALFDRREPVRVQADVAIPGGAGLGCSAALGVAVIGALDRHYGVERTRADRGEACFAWEKVFHGTPSGVDNTMAAVGGIALFRKGQPLEPVRARRVPSLVIAHSGESSSTKEVVAMVRRQHEKDPDRVNGVFESIAALVRNARLSLEAGDLESVGQLMNLNQGLLSTLMLSTERLETLCAIAREHGALGAKLTGAGGGGCMISLAPTAEVAETIRTALSKEADWTVVSQTREDLAS